MKTPTNALAQAAVNFAASGAREYLQRNDLGADPVRLHYLVKQEVSKALPEALRDADEAMQCGMGKIGEMTFAHSMVIAGIEGAKKASAEFLEEHEPVKVEFRPGTLELPPHFRQPYE